MFKVTLIAVGKIKQAYWREAIVTYQERLTPYAKVKIVEVLPEAFTEKTHQRSQTKEGERLAKILGDYEMRQIYLLDEKGKEYDSVSLAKWLEAKTDEVVMVIGGALGFSLEIKKQYPQKITFSRLTFPHELARVILLEQLYRASTISAGKTYHY